MAGYEKVLREDADRFMLTVAVYAEATGQDPKVVALTALADAVARLNESGALGPEEDEA